MEETLLNYERTGIFDELVPISCLENINLNLALDLIIQYLPEGSRYFSPDMITDRPENFIISEFIREQVFRLTQQEIPYHVGVKVSEINEGEDESLIRIYANIYVSHKLQKPILIGKGGKMIKKIGTHARRKIQQLLGTKVYLGLQVKVKKKWNKSDDQIERMIGQASFD